MLHGPEGSAVVSLNKHALWLHPPPTLFARQSTLEVDLLCRCRAPSRLQSSVATNFPAVSTHRLPAKFPQIWGRNWAGVRRCKSHFAQQNPALSQQIFLQNTNTVMGGRGIHLHMSCCRLTHDGLPMKDPPPPSLRPWREISLFFTWRPCLLG